MILDDTYALANGVEIPKLGLGTWMIPDEEAARVVREAVEIGYRHFDTAQAYANERGVGEGLRAGGFGGEHLAACIGYADTPRFGEETNPALLM